MKKKLGNGAPIIASSLMHRGSSVFDGAGNIQAGNKADNLKMIAETLQTLASGQEIVTEEEAATLEEMEASRREATAAILQDPKGEVARELADEIAGTVNMTVGKISYLRQILGYQPLSQGEIPEVEITNRKAVAAIMQGPTQCRLQVLEDADRIFPPEVDIEARIYVTRRRIDTSRRDVLQSSYQDAVEAVTIKEDRFVKVMADALVDSQGMGGTHIGSQTTPAAVEALVGKIMSYGLPVATILLPAARTANIMFSREWEDILEGVTRLELIRTGQIGTFFGATMITDAIAEKTTKVIEANEMYAFSTPEYVGEYTDRGGVRSTPIGVAETGISGAGFHLEEALSAAMPNHRAVSRVRFVG